MKKTTPSALALRPRVRFGFNSGTRVILSKKDRAGLRRNLNSELRRSVCE